MVVKSLRESKSPTRTLLVSRDPGEAENIERYTPTNLGNTSSKVSREYLISHDTTVTARSLQLLSIVFTISMLSLIETCFR